MTKQPDLLAVVGNLLRDLESAGYTPTLVGGMALALLGSNRVTKDFDFVISERAREDKPVVEIFYKHGFELISKLDKERVVRTIDNGSVASARLRIDHPPSAFFYHQSLLLRVDLLFDFPFPAAELLSRAIKRTVASYTFHIAHKDDLIRMKEIAARDRKFSGDVQDLDFLKKL